MDEYYLNSLAVESTPQSRNEKSTYLRRSFSSKSSNKNDDSFLSIKPGIGSIYSSPRARIPQDSSVASTNLSTSAFSSLFKSQYLMDTTEDVTVSVMGDAGDDVNVGNLFQEFLDFYQSYPGEHEVFDLLLQYEEMCCNCSNQLMHAVGKTAPLQQRFKSVDNVLQELRHERNTWRLIRTLYKDRIETINTDEDEMLMDMMGKRLSDKQLIENLFLRNSFVRQSQLVVDWLEKNAADDFSHIYQDKLEYFSNSSASWEHTLHDLMKQRTPLDRPLQDSLITELDPDAPLRQWNNVLHPSDKEAEARLLKFMFVKVRAGALDEAQQMAEKFGHPWLAASLEGWHLYHDPNYDNESLVEGESLKPVEGNKYRDIWKAACWRTAQKPGSSMHHEAMLGCLSGNLKAILPACINWDDYLWAYSRVLVDQLTEQELRSSTQCDRTLEELPPEYWDKMLDFEQIFQDIQACPLEDVRREGQGCHRTIQKFIILDDIDGLIEQLYSWSQQKDPPASFHLLRIMSHLILFFRVVGRIVKEELCIAILEAYVKELIAQHKIPLVAFYTAVLPRTHQVIWYAKFLEGVNDSSERQLSLKYAEEAGLDIPSITKTVVENVRTRVVETPEPSNISRTVTTEEDQQKINVIDWLVFNQSQRAEAVKQANALMRVFVASEKLDAAREVFLKVPNDSINVMMKQTKLSGNVTLKAEDDNAVREYLCFKAYLEAFDAFNDWFEHFQNAKPKRPEPPAGMNVKFKEKVAYEHEMRQYELELERWQNALMAQTKTTTDRLYNVMLFLSGGWMVDQRTEGPIDEGRQNQMALLRKLCIPQVTKLLHNVLHSTHKYKECVQLADIIASERHQLYKEFSIHELRQLLSTLRESSLCLLSQNLDPLGYQFL